MSVDVYDLSPNRGNVASELSVRLVVADHYMSRPLPGIDLAYSEFRGAEIKQVPVLRIFGPTPDGQKACVHIHGVFPYFYIPCGVSSPEPQILYQIAASLDKALNISLKQATSTNQHVYRITLVKGLPFYGFHYKDHLFFKVFLYNPNLIKQAVDLFSNGAILGQVFQPYEAHLNFTLQFFIDFNLFGMSNVDLQFVKFRRKGDSCSQTAHSGDIFSDSNESVKSESMCFYEVDALASNIINRQRVGNGDGIENPGLEEVWNQENKRRKLLNISMASKTLTQERDTLQTESHYRFENMFLFKISKSEEIPIPMDKDTVSYPAESYEGSELFNATDVSMHQPTNSSLYQSSDSSFRRYLEDTIVDESVAMNLSASDHNPITLDEEDLNFVEVLRDMDKYVEEDSILGTQVDVNNAINEELDDADYSQIFDDTMIVEGGFRTISNDNHDPEKSDIDDINWQDSFWEDANIPQVDGTFDDENTKNVYTRKKSHTKPVGLPHPKHKKKTSARRSKDSPEVCANEVRETQDLNGKSDMNVTALYEIKSHVEEESCHINQDERFKNHVMVQKSLIYDLQNNYEPTPGPSNVGKDGLNTNIMEYTDCIDHSYSSDSTPDEGIMSFYNISKIFQTENDASVCISDTESKYDIKLKEKSQEIDFNMASIRLQVTASTHRTNCNDIPLSHAENKIILAPQYRPPTPENIISSLKKYNIPENCHQKPYYSNFKDVGSKIEVGQLLLKLSSNAVQHQKAFTNIEGVMGIEQWRKYLFTEYNELSEDISEVDMKSLLAGNRKIVLEPINRPPTMKDVANWVSELSKESRCDEKALVPVEIENMTEDLEHSQVIGLDMEEAEKTVSLEHQEKEDTDLNHSLQVCLQPDGSFLCGGASKQNDASSLNTPIVERDHLTLMAIELHSAARGDLNPDPEHDAIKAIFLSVTNDFIPDQSRLMEMYAVDENRKHLERCALPISAIYVKDEEALLLKVVESVRKWDPDIVCGYETEQNSWGYLLERSKRLNVDLVPAISRITEKNRQRKWRTDDGNYEGKILGRVVLNVWRMLRHELALSSYSFENTMYHILKERVPKYSPASLDAWWTSDSTSQRWIPVDYYITRLSGTLRMLDKLDMINRTSELARLFGLQWWEVLSRGSQFRVESLMLRAARPLNLVALSPSVRQRATMRAPECLPLILEPESRFYSDPVIVLDFQSLYPSMMIAYNYCFSTCIGRIHNISGENSYEFGAWRLRIPKSKLEALSEKQLINWSPVGVGFVTPAVRRGVLPALLRRILAARQAVKKAMKAQSDEAVRKAMHSRQLGLKLIANVTYGYTAANFSGRMPCIEVGDSVVAKGRETLERAIALVRNSRRWNVKVVYGDTDSMFLLVPGGTRAQAFVIGQEIADAVTADNPSPVVLKLEKVYQPCILQTKKRYVGFMYESPDQREPVYEAKGIETVRRDGCPAAVKLLQRSLCCLFESGDVSAVKSLVVSALRRLAEGATPMLDLLFTREYNGPTGYRPGAVAPPLEIAKRLGARDHRAVPRTGERVSWAVVCGAPGLPLVRLARTPAELLVDPAARPHVLYYATRVILPPLHRCLSLVGADVFAWYRGIAIRPDSGVGGILQYMRRERCFACGERCAARRDICRACAASPHRAVPVVAHKIALVADRARNIDLICRSCCGHSHVQSCVSSECPLQWQRQATTVKLHQTAELIRNLPLTLRGADLQF